jgi:Flp pilus assembly pilin Flp
LPRKWQPASAAAAFFTNRQPVARHHRDVQRAAGSSMPPFVQQLARDSGGATAIEYAMVALLISIAGFSVLMTVGTSVTNLFQSIANSF